MDGFSFRLVFSQKTGRSYHLTIHLDENSKDLDDRVIFCKNSYHMSVDVCPAALLYETNKVADQPAYRTFLT